MKKIRNMLKFLDKSMKGRRGFFHKHPFISMSYENDATSFQAKKPDRLQLQTPLRSIMFSPGKYPKAHFRVNQL
ncbi:MAG: hypothetical protein AB7U29_19255 [Desulfobulbus sp.]